MRRITETYQTVQTRRTYIGTCPVCGKKASRTRTFWQTINPFNLTPEGLPKTAADIRADDERRADMYTPDFTHARCQES